MSDRARRNRAAQQRARRARRAVAVGVSVVVVLVVVMIALSLRGGGSGDDVSGPALSDLAQRGEEMAVRYGCVGCHGRSGEGGAEQAPALPEAYGVGVGARRLPAHAAGPE